MTPLRQFFGWLVLATTALLLLACAPQPTATPLPATATATAAPTATVPPPVSTLPPAPTRAPSPSPAPTDPFDGWKTITTDAFSINVPADWDVVDLSDEYLELVIEKLKKERPIVRLMMERSSQDFEQFELFAFGPQIDGVADGMNILAAPRSAQPPRDLDTYLREVIEPQFSLAGFKPTGKRTDLLTDGGLPMARILFTPPQIDNSPEMRGRQYFVLTDTDLWVLTYTTVADRTGRAPTEFEKSAKTFAPK